ncbi:MAG: hypothetical protein ACE5OZ_09715 [Candidatus Heimdallarchaeota archaeon]
MSTKFPTDATPGAHDPKLDFMQARSQILSGELPERLLSDDKLQFIAIHLFRAVDLLHYKGVRSEQITNSAQHLRRIQKTLLSQTVDQSLEKYSAGFVLGAFVDALHQLEANIHTTKEYNGVLDLLRTWRKQLSDTDTISKFIDDAVQAAEDLLHWSKDRSKALLPIGLEILKFIGTKETSEPIEVLKQITEATEEKEVFHFLAGSLQTSPSLHKAILLECSNQKISPEKTLAFLEQMMEQLRTSAKDPGMQSLANLFLKGYNSAKAKAEAQKNGN